MRIPHNCLILVADGRNMLLLRNAGMADAPDLKVEYGEEQPNPRDSEQKSDARGQMPATGTPGQASTAETDYHQQAEDDFARHIAEYLNGMALENRLDPLIVIAASRTLGELRHHYHPQVSDRIITEVDKVMTGYATDRIGEMLLEMEEASS